MTNSETAAPRDAAQDTIAMTSATMCHDIVGALLAELRGMPDHWSRLDASRQQLIVEELKVKTRTLVERALGLILSGNFQAVPAKLEFVNRKSGKGIRGGISVKSDALARHALFDASGGEVLVVIIDPKRYAERLDEIKAKGDQLDLFDPNANYDPKRDQPGYRRDHDPFAPADVPSWEQLRKSFGGGDPSTQQETQNSPASSIPEGPSLSPDQELAAARLMVQQMFAPLGLRVTLGEIHARTLEELEAAQEWAEAYTADREKCMIARPEWVSAPPGDSCN